LDQPISWGSLKEYFLICSKFVIAKHREAVYSQPIS
jgi:hypothetical protein